MFRALAFLEIQTRYNRIRARLLRLRQGRYLFGAIVGACYFYFYFVRFLFHSNGGPSTTMGMAPQYHDLFESGAAVLLMIWIVGMWVFPVERAALTFTEAEIAFLFPAPVGRRTLINYKLLKSQLAILLSALFISLIRARGGGHYWTRAMSWWGVMSVVNLHLLGSSFARTMLLDRGITHRQRRWMIFGVLGLAAAGLFLWARQTLPAPPAYSEDTHLFLTSLNAWVSQLLQAGPVPWLLLPFRLVVAPMFAQNMGSFAVAMLGVLLVIALHYFWVIGSNVAFEEASLEKSRKLAEVIAAVRSGQRPAVFRPRKAKGAPFQLQSLGWPGAAIFWKNLISVGYFFSWRSWLWLAWVAIIAGVALQHSQGRAQASAMAAFIGLFALLAVAMSLVSGPQILRHDFRQDLRIADLLKMYPMPAWQVVLGEILAPVAILVGVQWLALILAVVLSAKLPGGTPLDLSWRLGIGFAAAIVLPFVDVIALLLPNAAALLFPAWVALGRNAPRGMETMGQQIILMVAQVLVLALSLLPAAIAFAALYFIGHTFFGALAGILMGAVAGAVVLALVGALGVHLLGHAFEKFDWLETASEGASGN